MRKLIILLICLLSVTSYSAWDNDKPADNRAWNLAAGDIRANNDAIEAAFGVDLANVTTTGDYAVFNVKNTAYGALGDGTTDDTSAIQLAITAASAAGGGIIFFPLGTYIISGSNGIVADDDMIFLGTGWGSILKLKGPLSANSNRMVLVNGKTRVIFKDLAFNGNNTGRTGAGNSTRSGPVIKGASSDILITHCRFYNNTKASSGVTVESPTGSLSFKIVVTNCHFNDLDVGVITTGVKNMVVSNCTFKDIVSEGISYWWDTGFEQNIEVSAIGNTMENITSGRAIVFFNTDGFTCVGNTMRTLATAGIGINNVKNGVISGNTIKDYASGGIQGGIEVLTYDGTTTFQVENVAITSNVIENAVADDDLCRAIHMWGVGPKTKLLIANNICDDADFGIYLRQATHSSITGNLVTDMDVAGIQIIDPNSNNVLITNNRAWSNVTNIDIRSTGVNVDVLNNFTDDAGSSLNLMAITIVDISSAEILDIEATAITLVAAPGANKYLELVSAVLILDEGTIDFDDAASDGNLVIGYNNTSGVKVSQDIEADGFIDATVDTITNAIPKKDAIVAASASVNKALVLFNDGTTFSGATANGVLQVITTYRLHTSLGL